MPFGDDYNPGNTAVLILVGDRVEEVTGLLTMLGQARIGRLYVAADGPVADSESGTACDSIATITSGIDWPCEIRTRVEKRRLGKKRAQCRAIDWFFESERCGTIIEAGVNPAPEFFGFCSWALEKFEREPRVWQINGRTFGAPASLFGDSDWAFSALPETTGWATWRDRWQRFTPNPFYVAEANDERRKCWRISRRSALNIMRIQRLAASEPACWEPFWTSTVLNHRGVVVCPRVDLIPQPDTGNTATGAGHDGLLEHPDRRAGSSAVPAPEPNRRLTRWYETHRALRRFGGAFRELAHRTSQSARTAGNRGLARLMFGPNTDPVVVASSGRSGSTMLAESIAKARVRGRFGGRWPERIDRLFLEMAVEFIPRLEQLGRAKSPVIKTHDLPCDVVVARGKYLFVFGDPLEAALSARLRAERDGHIWFEEHLYHLRGDGDLMDLFHRDLLNYRQQLLEWRARMGNNVLLVPMKELWRREAAIAKFLGLPLKLPEEQARQTKVGPEDGKSGLYRDLRRCYEETVSMADEHFRRLGLRHD